MQVLILRRYCGLHFQVELLSGNARQHVKPEGCKDRSNDKSHTHFNVVLTVISLTKAVHCLSLSEDKRSRFSMANIKMLHMNELMTKRIFATLNPGLSNSKNQITLSPMPELRQAQSVKTTALLIRGKEKIHSRFGLNENSTYLFAEFPPAHPIKRPSTIL